MIRAPQSWAHVDGRKPARRPMDVVVVLPDSLPVRYRRAFRATTDAIGQALAIYPTAVRISVKPVPREVQA